MVEEGCARDVLGARSGFPLHNMENPGCMKSCICLDFQSSPSDVLMAQCLHPPSCNGTRKKSLVSKVSGKPVSIVCMVYLFS